MGAITRARRALDRVEARRQRGGNRRLRPEKDVVVQYDETLPGVKFFRYPDGSAIRVDHEGTHNSVEYNEF